MLSPENIRGNIVSHNSSLHLGDPYFVLNLVWLTGMKVFIFTPLLFTFLRVNFFLRLYFSKN